MKQKKLHTAEEKIMIVREHLENHVPVSDLSEKYGLHPNAIYQWKKQLFEEGPQTLARKTKKKEKAQSDLARENEELKAMLAKRESLISELVEENIDLKKKANGKVLIRNGSNPKSGTRL